MTSQGISQKASPWSKPAAALLLAVVAALPLGAATGVLVEAPRRVVGIEIFPRTVVPYHSARYEVEGTALDVYYTASELPLPGNPEIDACGTRELQRIDEQVGLFLDLTRDLPLDRQPCSLAALVHDVQQLLQHRAGRAGVELVPVQVAATAGSALIDGDARRLR
ncbi:MAG: hypothetical protein ACOC4F_03660, partial [bacterium]